MMLKTLIRNVAIILLINEFFYRARTFYFISPE